MILETSKQGMLDWVHYNAPISFEIYSIYEKSSFRIGLFKTIRYFTTCSILVQLLTNSPTHRVAKPALENALGKFLYGELEKLEVEVRGGDLFITIWDLHLNPKVCIFYHRSKFLRGYSYFFLA